MSLAHFVYVAASVVFVGVWTYAIIYNHRVGARIRQLEAWGRQMSSKEEGIAVVSLERERSGRSGSVA